MYLGQNTDELEKLKAFHTAKEICQQGDMWKLLPLLLDDVSEEALAELRHMAGDKEAHIIFTGAGTSAYIGNILAVSLNNLCKAHVSSIPTTDIVTAPYRYFEEGKKAIVVSFARSGNSPESLDAVEKIEQIAPHIQHIYITCNKEGGLAKRAKDAKQASLYLMPEPTHDVSFVMTSSFSSMLLFAYGLFIKALKGKLDFDYDDLAKQSDDIAKNFHKNKLFDNITAMERIVYLGSNSLFGAAQEAALKAVEMTQGQIVTMAETSLGFRHGPKSIIQSQTLICVFVSPHTYTQLFDKDMINELIAEGDVAQIVVFAPQAFFEKYDFSDCDIVKIENNQEFNDCDDALLAPLYVNYAQIIGFFMAVGLGYSPDNPCPTGQVNRVVQGVTLYDYEP